MRPRHRRVLMVIPFAVLLLSLAEATADGERESEKARTKEAREAKGSDEKKDRRPLIPYIPPRRVRVAPAIRTSSGTRALGSDLPDVTLLVPDHVGLTLEAQPTLYWELSRGTPAWIHVTLLDLGDHESVAPLLAVPIHGPTSAGIHPFRITDHEIRLEVGKTYEWSVAVVPDPDRGVGDKVARALIERTAPSESLRADLAGVDDRMRGRVLARNGIWYDAFAVLSEGIAGNPSDRTLRAERASLLEQVGLSELAGRERAAADAH